MIQRLALRALAALAAASIAAAALADEARVALAGHVLPALSEARVAQVAKAASSEAEPMTLTIVLRRTDEAGFQRFLADLYDPTSPRYRRFLGATEIADRFGPSVEDYSVVKRYFSAQGLSVVEESANRMTLAVAGTRAQVERALDVAIGDFEVDEPGGKTRRFHANTDEPRVPVSIADRVQAVAGLSSLAQPRHPVAGLEWSINSLKSCIKDTKIENAGLIVGCSIIYALLSIVYDIGCANPAYALSAWIRGDPPCTMFNPFSASAPTSAAQRPRTPVGAGQKIGIVAFDTFSTSDVADFVALTGGPATRLDQLAVVPVAGGAPPGASQSEVLLDVDTVLILAPGADVAVYSAPFSAGSFQAVFNRMVADGMTVISNSWAYCEDQTTLADVQSIDAILATASAAGISVFNGSGDTGSTCLDGAPNTVAVPASSPHATAVGGTSVVVGAGGVHVGETWWDGSTQTPPGGQGGFGTSRYFARPAYQNALTASPMRSVPDLAVNADPAALGVVICQAAKGGCPSGLLYGGTSFSAPQMAAYTAALNQAHGSNLGLLNALAYPLAGTSAFHTPASMGSDFAHVGLGSPNFSFLALALRSGTPGTPSAAMSLVHRTSQTVAADGASTASIVVQLRDASGAAVPGKTVTLAASPSANVAVAPASGVSTTANGTVVFTVKDATVEDVTFTATDTTDGVVVAKTDVVSFVVPPAAAASIAANPTSVLNDGVATTTITVVLKDSLNRPSPGKEVRLSQESGHSVIGAPVPSVTDVNGQIQFTAADRTPETVTYAAVDVTDGDLPVPGSAVVTFSGTANTSCVGTPPTAAPGYAMSAFATGFAARNFFYSNVNWGGCPGTSNPTFTTDGSVYVADFPDGTLFKMPASGGAATNAYLLSTIGQTLTQPTFGKDGKLYAARGATGSGFNSGVILELDPVTGAPIRTVMSNLTCPAGLSVDPLSGDLFFDDDCYGAGSDNPSLWRIRNPASATPTLEVYATLPATPNGWISFSPDGTLYVVSGYTSASPPVLAVSGTDMPQPPTITPIPGLASLFWVTVAQTLPSGAAKSLIVLDNATGLRLADITANPVTTTQLTNGTLSSGVIGPDGCIYAGLSDTIFRITPATGPCIFATTTQAPGLRLAPAVATPNPTQGTQQTLTAQFVNVAVPANTPVLFLVSGANEQMRLGRTDANGRATVSYVGGFAGADRVTATATIGSTDYTSNVAIVTWDPGSHVSGLTLNASPSGAIAGHAVTLAASLVDVSADPAVALAGASVHFTLGAQSCDGVTDASGVATCALTPPAAGTLTLAASYAGSGPHLPAAASQAFHVFSIGQQRAFVASYGLDTNGCVIAAPCRSFAVAIARLVAGGEVIVLDSAGYGPFTIVQPVAIMAPPGVYAGVTVSGGTGVVVDPGAGQVTLRGLTINALGGNVGIDFKSGDALFVDHTTVSGFSAAGLRAQTSAAAAVHVVDSRLRDNGIGADFSPLASASGSLDASIERSRIERNATGVRFAGKSTTGSIRGSLVAGGASGVAVVPSVAGASAAIEIRRSTLSGASGAALAVAPGAGALAAVAILSSEVVQNGTGLSLSGGGSALASDTTIARNATGIATAGGSAVSVGDNRLFGNGVDGSFTSTVGKQ